jgi:hypothetical protein
LNRRAAAIVIAALWLGGVAWMLWRNHSGNPAQRLTEAAIRVEPARYYYTIAYKGEKIGAASSAVDTLAHAILGDDFFSGRFPSGDSLAPVSARMQTRLTRGARLSSISLQINRAGQLTQSSVRDDDDTLLTITKGKGKGSIVTAQSVQKPVVTPALIGIPLILAEPPAVGRSENLVVLNPVTSRPQARVLKIVAESLFTVVDSATRTPDGRWVTAHRDTLRAWRVGGDTDGLSVWLDGGGRIVSAISAAGFSATRTAYEIAFEKPKTK